MPPATDTTVAPRVPDAAPAPLRSTAPVAPALVLELSLVAAAAAATVGLASVTGSPESRQTVAYLLCFFVILPVAMALGPRLDHWLRGIPGPMAAILAASAAIGVLSVLLAARVVSAAGGPGAPVLVGGVVVWCLGALAARRIVRSDRRPAWLTPPVGPRAPMAAWAATVAFAVASTLGFVPDRLRGPLSLAICFAVGAALTSLVLAAERIRLSRRLGMAIDVLFVVLIVLAVVDASSLLPYLPWDAARAPASPVGADHVSVVLTHQSFYLGPVTDVLHGHAVLVDTFCQYGVGVIYFLAAIFAVVPLGYGPMALVSGVLTGLACAAGYGILRLAGCRRATAAIAIALGIAVTQWQVIGSAADFPSLGALRFGPAYLLILIVVARARWTARARELRAVELVVVGISAIWSLEALVYALAIAFAAEGIEAATSQASWQARGRRWLTGVAWALGAAVTAVVALAVLTRLFSGHWPDWSSYIAFLTLYSGRTVPGVFTFPAIGAWSSGFAVGFIYLASAVTIGRLASVARLRPEVRPRLVAAAALTGFGILSLSYWITHGDPLFLRWVALPAVLLGALWVDLAFGATRLAPRMRLVGLALGSLVAALLGVFTWPQATETADRTALIHAVPGSSSLRHDVGSLWHAPRLDPRSREGEAALRRYAPGHSAVLMLVERDLGLEILMRSGRANAVALGYPLQSDLIAGHLRTRVRRAVGRLAPGTLALVQDRSRYTTRFVPGHNALLDEATVVVLRRFAPRVLATTPSGLAVVRLEKRR